MTALPPLSLDDLSYEDLRRMAERRIPAASGGRWTHHAPVDPGVTLLELFAFLLDQQIFVLDQMPDTLTHALLALLGEAPRPTGVARTAVALVPGALDAAQVLPAGTPLRPDGASPAALVFSTRDETLLLPVARQESFADGRPVGDRLERGEAVPVMAAHGAPGSVALEVALAAPLGPAETGRPLGLAVILAEAGVPAAWAPGAAEAPPPAPLMLDWAAPGAGGRIEDVEDGTGGLRRSGILRFALPAKAAGADRLRLTLSTARASHAEPPRLARLALGAVVAEHRRRVGIEGHDTGNAEHDRLRAALRAAVGALLPVSGQTLVLPPELSPVIEDGLALRLADRSGRFHDWTRVANLAATDRADRVFAVDRALGQLAFGDGYAGRVPAPATDVALTADLGGGTEGNHAAGLVWRPADPSRAGRLVSLAPAEGGAEPETMEAARARVASGLAVRHRAVTAADFATLVETAPGIAAHRAHVAAGHDPSFPCLHVADSVTVFVVPRTGAAAPAPEADAGALGVIRERLEAARMLTTRVFVRRPAIRPVALSLQLSGTMGDSGALSARLRRTLSDYLHPSLGGPEGTGWPFGRSLRPSELLRVAEASLPPGGRVERVGIALADTGAAEEECSEVAIGPADLVRLDRLRLDLRRGARLAETAL